MSIAETMALNRAKQAQDALLEIMQAQADLNRLWDKYRGILSAIESDFRMYLQTAEVERLKSLEATHAQQ